MPEGVLLERFGMCGIDQLYEETNIFENVF